MLEARPAPQEGAGDIEEDLDKARAVGRWLDALGPAVRRSDRGALAADLGDLYAGAARYRQLLDALLALPGDRAGEVDDLLVELSAELRHLAWHIRSSTRRLERLADGMEPGDEEDDGRSTG
jgi:hypothetical protein